jgi:hypothetical protein
VTRHTLEQAVPDPTTVDYVEGFSTGRLEAVRVIVSRDVDGLEATRGRLPADTPADVRDAYNEAIAILRDAATSATAAAEPPPEFVEPDTTGA